MPDYSVIKNDTVINVIIAESEEIARAVSGDGEVVERVNGVPGKGWNRDNNGWITNRPAPFPSWTWNYAAHIYEAPIPMPDDGESYVWNEDSLEWEVVPPAVEEDVVGE